MNVGEKQVELTDMITKDGKLKKKKAKRQMSPEEIKEKLRKLRGACQCNLEIMRVALFHLEIKSYTSPFVSYEGLLIVH